MNDINKKCWDWYPVVDSLHIGYELRISCSPNYLREALNTIPPNLDLLDLYMCKIKNKTVIEMYTIKEAQRLLKISEL